MRPLSGHCFLVILSLAIISRCSIAASDDQEDYLDTDGEEDVQDEAIDCPPEFLNKCTCGKVSDSTFDTIMSKSSSSKSSSSSSSSFVVNCSQGGFNDSRPLSYLPNGTEILIFTNHNLSSELPINIFGDNNLSNLDNLKLIDLSNNSITFLKGKTFHRVKNVKKLILDHNKIRITGEHFHPRIFSNFEHLEELSLKRSFDTLNNGLNFMSDLITIFAEARLSKLKVLHLESNSIKNIPSPSDFCYLPSLTKLFLRGNLLTDIKINTSCIPNLRILDVSDNFIENLSNSSLKYIPENVRLHFNLTANPFRCDCHLLDFLKWSKTTQAWINGKKNVCANGFPKSNTGKIVFELQESDLQCPSSSSISSSLLESELHGYVTASFAVLISLILALMVLIIALIASHREQVSKICGLVASSFHGKREYTSLGQESKEDKIRIPIKNSNSIEVDEVAV